MSDAFLDKFMAELIKGAEQSEGFIRGGRVGVEVSRENRGREEKLASANNLLASQYAKGSHAALERFGIKEAFLPLLGMAGSLLGGTAARAGLGMAAKGLAGKAGIGGMLGRGAQSALNWAGKSPMRGAALDMAGSMAGGAAGNMLQGGGQ